MLTRLAASLALVLGLGSTSVCAQQFLDFDGWANDITPDGSVVVGQSATGAFYWRWQVDPEPVQIGGVTALAVSDDGTVIAGNMFDPDLGLLAAGRWTEATGWVSLGGGIGSCSSLSEVSGMTGDGKQIVGLTWDLCNSRGFRWTEGVGLELLEELGNGTNRASAIARDGSVMGGYAQGTTDHTPATWMPDTSGTLWDIDALGEITRFDDTGSTSVGAYVFGGTLRSAFMNSSAGGLVDLGKLHPTWHSAAYDISEDGRVAVGFDYFFLSRQAWIWNAGSGLESLQSRLTFLGVGGVPDLSVATACSASGRTIVGGYGSGRAYIAVLAPEAWNQQGAGIAGGNGTPVLTGSGTLAAGTPAALALTHGPANGGATLVLGLSALMAPFKQGVLVPNPDVLFSGLPLDGDGALLLQSTWPAGIPAGTSAWWQAWMADGAAPAGFSSSNGARSTTP